MRHVAACQHTGSPRSTTSTMTNAVPGLSTVRPTGRSAAAATRGRCMATECNGDQPDPTFCQEHEQVPLAGCWWPAHSHGPGALLARERLADLQGQVRGVNSRASPGIDFMG